MYQILGHCEFRSAQIVSTWSCIVYGLFLNRFTPLRITSKLMKKRRKQQILEFLNIHQDWATFVVVLRPYSQSYYSHIRSHIERHIRSQSKARIKITSNSTFKIILKSEFDMGPGPGPDGGPGG